MRGAGNQRLAIRHMRSQGTRPFWLRRDSTRCQWRTTWNRNTLSAGPFMGTPKYRLCPSTTERNHLPTSGTGACIRRLSSAFTSLSLACNRARIVCRSTVNLPLLRFFPQMWVKPRKLKVSGLP